MRGSTETCLGELLYMLRCWVTDKDVPSDALTDAVIAWVDDQRPTTGPHAQALYDALRGCDAALLASGMGK